MLFDRWKAWKEQRALARRAIDDALWATTLQSHPFLAQRSEADLQALRRLSSLFLDRKEFTGVDGFVVTDKVAVAVAAQACLPILHLGLEMYDDFVGIVMHASEVRARRSVQDEAGLVHEYDEVLSGEAVEGGPVMLSWADVSGAWRDHEDADTATEDRGDQPAWAYNVVIHEFAHVLDLRDGEADGVPLLPTAEQRRRWLVVMQEHYDHFRERVVCGHDTLLDPYGAQSIDEFFAVASEAFFVTPVAFRDEHASLHRIFVNYYRQDPGASCR